MFCFIDPAFSVLLPAVFAYRGRDLFICVEEEFVCMEAYAHGAVYTGGGESPGKEQNCLPPRTL